MSITSSSGSKTLAQLPSARDLWLVLIPLVLSFCVFWQVRHFEAISYDDPAHLYENEAIKPGLTSQGVKWALTQTGETNLWHPVTWFSFMLDVEIFGLDVLAGHHLTNLGLHLVAVALLYLLLLHYFEQSWLALLLCCLWAIHPHRAQNVAWISGRKDVLAMAFLLGSWLAWVKSTRTLKSGLTLLSLLLFTLSMMSKPSAVGLPLILIASDFLFKKPLTQKSKVSIGAFLAVSLLTAALALYFQKQGGLAEVDQARPLGTRLLQLPFTLWWYLQATIFSNGTFWVYSPTSTTHLTVIPCIGLALVAGLIFRFRKNSLILFGSAAVIFFWLPVSGLTSVSFYQVAERYSYFIQLGILFVLGGALLELLQKGQSHRTINFLAMAGITASLLLAKVTYQRTALWENDLQFFTAEETINPRSLLAQIFLGNAHKTAQDWSTALGHYHQALRLDPESGLAATHAGSCYEELGELAQAHEYYHQATQAKVLQDATPFQKLALLLHSQKKTPNAIEVLISGIDRFPREPILHYDLATFYLRHEHNPEAALQHYEKALSLAPNFREAKLGKALSLQELRKPKESKQLLREFKALE